MKKPIQALRGFLVGSKKDVEPTKEISKSNPFDVINSVENDMDLSTNRRASNLASKETNPSRSSFWNMEANSTSNTLIVDKIDKYEELIIDERVSLVDDEGKPLKKVDYPDDHGCEDEVELVDNDMARFLALETVGFGTNSLLDNGGILMRMLIMNVTHTTMICMKDKKFLTRFNLYVSSNLDRGAIDESDGFRKIKIEFDAFGFSVKDFLTCHILLRCDSSGDLYPFTSPSPTPHALLSVSPSTWHQRLSAKPDPCFHGHTSRTSPISPIRKSPSVALSNPNWRNAMYYEYKALIKNNTWVLVLKPPNVNVVQSMAHMVNCNPTRAPVVTESNLGSDGDPISDPTLYRSLADGLQYLTFTRPDISYTVQQTLGSKFMHPLHVLLLLNYTDADWAGCPTTRRSTSGYCVFLRDNLLSWSAKRQHTLSRSSAEAEYRGVANVVAETAWLRNLLRELHTPLLSVTLVYCDNIRVLHVPSRYQYADIFTKGLSSAL
uniref:Uncharacterized protein n=1 Tax=Tanacetum cinerariifolium TaxID=118510 RepID=A0A699H1P4_TANCI|nr:hypothetical protein [Tanacetum cinerariifolium]